ncbi:MAG TPA: T9SS type A sorting domain-containing protein [Bacteroidia bacterium]|jgi:hypothetical protein
MYSGREFSGFATFDGSQFCFYDSVPCSNDPGSPFTKIAFYNDSLIVAGGRIAYNGDTINYIGQYHGDFSSTWGCENVVGIKEQHPDDHELLVYPNPGHYQITIEFPADFIKGSTLSLKNSLGQTIQSFTLNGSDNKVLVDVNEYPRGVYIILLQNEGNIRVKKFVKG